MKFSLHPILTTEVVLLLTVGALNSAPAERSVSYSRQFIIYGEATPLRGAVADLAEKTKANLLNLLQQRDEWKIPIVLYLQLPQANLPEIPPAALRFSQTGAGLKIQLDLTIGSDLDVLALRRQLLRVILLEMIYRQSADLPAGSFYVEPPDWLVEGVLAADPLTDRTELIQAATSLVADARVVTLQEFLGQKRALLDTPGQLIYRAYSLAILQLLLNQPDGANHLETYIKQLAAASSDPLADLKAQFPILEATADVDAIWKTSVSNLVANQLYELLTPAETERQLASLLGTGTQEVTLGALNLADHLKKKLSPSEAAELRVVKQKLMLLGTRTNPIFRPLIFEYQQIVDRILNHRLKGLDTRLARAAAKRDRIRRRTGEIDDYMNWFEATKADSASGAFTGYLRAAAGATEPRPRRRDPVSVYLDALEEQFTPDPVNR